MSSPYMLQEQEDNSNLPTSSAYSLNAQFSQKYPNLDPYADSSPLFQTTKKPHSKYTVRKKKKYFSTSNNDSDGEISEKIDRRKDTLPDNYLDLLITAADKMMNSGEITMEYLNSKTIPMLKLRIDYSNNSDEEESTKLTRKCENKMCAVNVEDAHDLYSAKFNHSNSYKCQNLKLCKKCYEAFKLENYCYYCNAIYRNFQFNEQYYDRKKWILCEYCEKWQHMQCEEKKGVYKNIEKLAMDKNFNYMCPFCRNQNEMFAKQQNKIDQGKY